MNLRFILLINKVSSFIKFFIRLPLIVNILKQALILLAFFVKALIKYQRVELTISNMFLFKLYNNNALTLVYA